MARVKPRMGDALMISVETRELGSHTWAGIAECECGQATYTGVSFSEQSVIKLMRRKHVKHLVTCTRQAELFALDKE